MFVSATRERVQVLLGEGLSKAETARRLGLAYNTVHYHSKRPSASPASSVENATHAPQTEKLLVPVSTGSEVRRLLAGGLTRAETASRLKVSKSTVSYHARRFGMPIDPRAARRYDWGLIQRYYDEGHTVRECVAHFGFSKQAWHAAKRCGVLVTRSRTMTIEQLLSAPRTRDHLKRRLIGAGLLPQRCRECGIASWRGKPLALELHHINGLGQDNRLENLALLCPNCHSQTATWGGRNSSPARDRATGAHAERRAPANPACGIGGAQSPPRRYSAARCPSGAK